MTKELLLLRHTKSSWDEPGLSDFDRPLAPRGRKDAPRIGRALAELKWRPQMALVSPSARTRETWKLVKAETKHLPKPTFSEALYETPAEQLLAKLRHVPEKVDSLMLLGHNPGLQDLALRLAGQGSDEAILQKLRKKLPTGGLARLEFDGSWNELGQGEARLTHLLRPKDFANGH